MTNARILMIGGYGPSHPKNGGGQLIAYNLYHTLKSRSIDIDYLAIDSEQDGILTKHPNIIHVLPTQLLKQIKTFKNIDLEKYSIIHIHSANELHGIMISLMLTKIMKPETKIILSLQYPVTHILPRSTVEITNNLLSKAANCVLCLSEQSRTTICRNYMLSLDKVGVTYPGVEEKYLTHIKKVDHIVKGRYKLLFVGRFGDRHNQKGLDIMIKALPLIARELDIELNVVGPGDATQYNSTITQLGLEDQVKFRGIIRGEALIQEYVSSDIFVFPSRRESFGLVLAEAMSLGLPVVTTNIGAIPEVVKNNETGILVPADDSIALADAVIRLLNNPELRRAMGSNGITWVNERFTMNTMADKVQEYYNSML